MNRLYRKLLGWMQRRCDHRDLSCDLSLGKGEGRVVRWCSACGVLKITLDAEAAKREGW